MPRCAAEDLWHAYNLIREGDVVTATTFRKVQRDLGAGSESEKVKLRLSVEVETVDFDPDGASEVLPSTHGPVVVVPWTGPCAREGSTQPNGPECHVLPMCEIEQASAAHAC